MHPALLALVLSAIVILLGVLVYILVVLRLEETDYLEDPIEREMAETHARIADDTDQRARPR